MEMSEHRFFKCFEAADAGRLMENVIIEKLPAQTLLFSEGDSPDSVCVVLQGRIELFKALHDGQSRVMAVVGEGDYFGEMGAIDGMARSTGAVTSEPSVVAKLPRHEFLKMLNETPGRSALALTRQILENLRATNNRYIAEIIRKEKLTLVGEMANTIIHDIRGPFTAIQLGSDLISASTEDAQIKDVCRMMSLQVERASSMIEELLEFSRGISSMKKEKIPLSALMDRFCFLNKDFFQKSRVKLEVHADQTDVYVDPNKMIRAIQNIVNNAIEVLNKREDGVIRISTRQHEGGGEIEISIQDNGPGIPDAIREKVFEPFVTHGKKQGTGLGMAIVKSIIEAHSGKVTFSTEANKGTTFFIYLPGQ